MKKVLLFILCVLVGCIVYCYSGGGSVDSSKAEASCVVDCERAGASGWLVVGSDCSCIF